MTQNNKLFAVSDMKAALSTLWIFVLFNMAFADIIGFVEPGTLQTILAGAAPISNQKQWHLHWRGTYRYSCPRRCLRDRQRRYKAG